MTQQRANGPFKIYVLRGDSFENSWQFDVVSAGLNFVSNEVGFHSNQSCCTLRRVTKSRPNFAWLQTFYLGSPLRHLRCWKWIVFTQKKSTPGTQFQTHSVLRQYYSFNSEIMKVCWNVMVVLEVINWKATNDDLNQAYCRFCGYGCNWNFQKIEFFRILLEFWQNFSWDFIKFILVIENIFPWVSERPSIYWIFDKNLHFLY